MSSPFNLFADLPDASCGEVFTDLLARPGCRIERIVSHGQITPVDQPWCQAHDEWVVVLKGEAGVEVSGEVSELQPGDTLFIPAHAEHRVTFTATDQPTLWLAVHMEGQ